MARKKSATTDGANQSKPFVASELVASTHATANAMPVIAQGLQMRNLELQEHLVPGPAELAECAARSWCLEAGSSCSTDGVPPGPEVDLPPSDDVTPAGNFVAFDGVAPLLPQLPTDVLRPALNHQRAQLTKVQGPAVPDEAIQCLAGLGCSLDCAAIAAWAILLGRHGRVSDVSLCVWRAPNQPWLTMRVSLLRDEPQTDAAEGEGEGSSVTPLHVFAQVGVVAKRVATSLSMLHAAADFKSAASLAQLDGSLSADTAPGEDGFYRTLDVAISFGEPPAHATSLRHPLSLVFPHWRTAADRAASGPAQLHFARGAFSHETGSRLLRQFHALLAQFPLCWAAPVCSVSLHISGNSDVAGIAQVCESNEAVDIRKWSDAFSTSVYCKNNLASEFWDADRSILALFDEHVRCRPHTVALVDDGTGETLKYHDLDNLIRNVASTLIEVGVGPDVLVPLMAPRCTPMIVGMLAIIRAGGAYVPIDLHWPDSRLSDVLEQCGSQVLLCTRGVGFRAESVGSGRNVVYIEDTMRQQSADRRMPTAEGKDLVYVFFTSGTTGKPKGVMVEHRGLTHRIHWFQTQWPLAPGEGVVQKVAYTFGLSEWEIFWPLCSGATLILAPPDGEKDSDYLLRRACGAFDPPSALSQRGIGGVGRTPVAAHVFVPSALQMVLDRFDELEEQELTSPEGGVSDAGPWWRAWPARQIITCGEPLTMALAQRLFSRVPGVELVNLYGPTEGEMTVWKVPRGPALSRMLVGAPMKGSKVVLSDLRERKLAAALEPAEIGFGGPFIARGYLGRPDLDEKTFVPDFSCEDWSRGTSGRLYLTGDLGRWREGDVELLGRSDFQIKLRGFRIELGEIEAAVRQAGARAAVCVLRPGAGGAPALVAYYEPGPKGSDVPAAAVQASCRKLLPPYMQPQTVAQLERLPRNSNGKVDRARLPSPETLGLCAGGGQSDSITLPETPTEQAIASIWAEVLQVETSKVPVDVDFVELGGSSLLAGRVTALIRARLHAPGLPGTCMYKYSTIRRLAPVVQAVRDTHAPEDDVECASPSSHLLLPPAMRPARTALSSTRPFALLVQSMGVCIMYTIFDADGLSPVWLGGYYIFTTYGTGALFASLPLLTFLEVVFKLLMVILLKALFVGKVKPGKYPVWGGSYFRWWFGNQLAHLSTTNLLPIFAETPLLNVCLRMLGAQIGKDVRIGVVSILDPDLVILEDGVTLGCNAKFASSTVLHGEVHMDYIRVSKGASVGPGALLAQGTHVPEGRAVLPMSTMPAWHGAMGSVAHQQAVDIVCYDFQRRQDLLRCVVGLPLVFLLRSLPYFPAILALMTLWDVLAALCGDQAFNVFCLLAPWVYGNILWISFVFVTILFKRLVVGRFEVSPRGNSHATEFKHWLHGRMVESHEFESTCEILINTEMLTTIYRCLGARIGRRVQIDKFNLVEHDCLAIEDYAVFGSKIVMSCDARAPWTPRSSSLGGPASLGFEQVRISQGANALDHCVFLPGVTVGERAVLGSCTLAPHKSYFAPLTIHTGSVRGRPTYLRDSTSTKAVKLLEDQALQDLDDPVSWWCFNVFLLFLILLAKPLHEVIWTAVYMMLYTVCDPEVHGMLGFVLQLPVLHCALLVCELALLVALKWVVMGRYKAGDCRFFSSYHYRWMTLMMLDHAANVSTLLNGTAFNAWFYRALGAKVGRNCYLSGVAVEYDLLEIGDDVAIGNHSDTTCHTVENMVIKLAPVRLQSGACLCPFSFAMPGSTVEEDAVLLEHTQVLKGETVPSGEVWAGIPAARCKPVAPQRGESDYVAMQEIASPGRHASRAHTYTRLLA